jgi:hypothetical protein
MFKERAYANTHIVVGESNNAQSTPNSQLSTIRKQSGGWWQPSVYRYRACGLQTTTTRIGATPMFG